MANKMTDPEAGLRNKRVMTNLTAADHARLLAIIKEHKLRTISDGIRWLILHAPAK